MAEKRVRKRCEGCGDAGAYLSRVRRCRRQIRRGFGWVICGGRLVAVPAQPKARPEVRPQDVAAKKLAHARKLIAEKTRAMRRLVTSIYQWERRAFRYAQMASKTDEELAAERAARVAAAERRKAARQRRGIKLDGAL